MYFYMADILKDIDSWLIVTEFQWLEKLLFHSDITKNRDNILKSIWNIFSYKDYIIDDWLKHDYNNAIVFLWYIEMSINDIIKADFEYEEYFSYAKNMVSDILWLKSTYSISDAKDIVKELSLTNKLNVDLVIDLWIDLPNEAISINNWYLSSATENISNKNKLDNMFPEINFELRRFFQNLFKNSKESWATKISITFSKLLYSQRVIIKYLDDWNWMTSNTILNTLFIKGKSTKLDSWKNLWEWMNGLVSSLYDKQIDLDIYSSTTEEWYTGVWFLNSSFNEILKGKTDIDRYIVKLDEKSYYNKSFPNKTWTEFIFKFN